MRKPWQIPSGRNPVVQATARERLHAKLDALTPAARGEFEVELMAVEAQRDRELSDVEAIQLFELFAATAPAPIFR